MMKELRKFVAPEFVFGTGALHLAGRYSRNFGGHKVLVVTDPGIIDAGWTDQVTVALEAEGLPYTIFSKVTPNPRSEEVMEGAEVYQNECCNIIVAVGGGSTMDCAKGIGIVSSNKRHILEFEGVDQVPIPAPPLICIPTTAGSSADVSQFAIINDTRQKVKIAIISKAVVPDVALIDPATTTTMDSYLTACTGMDALSHGIEAFVSNAHSNITDLHSIEAIRLITANLPSAIADGENIDLRSKMMLGSLHAGLAFSNASLGAVHAMAHSLGGYLDLPHGECNALLLKHVVAFNFDEHSERYRLIGKAMGLDIPLNEPRRIRSAILQEINRLCEASGINRTLHQIGVRRICIPELAKNAMKDPCMVTNPRRPSLEDIEAIYEAAL